MASEPRSLAPAEKSAPPTELEPKTKPKVKARAPEARQDEDSIARAWIGLWAALQVLVLLLGRFFVKPGLTVRLGTLSLREARDDSAALAPAFHRFPGIATVVAFIGGPIAAVKRVQEKIEVTGEPKEKPKEPPRAEEPARPA